MMFLGIAYMNMAVMNFVTYSLMRDAAAVFYTGSKHG